MKNGKPKKNTDQNYKKVKGLQREKICNIKLRNVEFCLLKHEKVTFLTNLQPVFPKNNYTLLFYFGTFTLGPLYLI